MINRMDLFMTYEHKPYSKTILTELLVKLWNESLTDKLNLGLKLNLFNVILRWLEDSLTTHQRNNEIRKQTLENWDVV